MIRTERISISAEYEAVSPLPFATRRTVPLPGKSFTRIRNEANLSPFDVKDKVCEALPTISILEEQEAETDTSPTPSSVAKTVAGTSISSPVPITRGKVPSNMTGFFTKTLFSAFP